ncbi:YceI family protein [Chitinophaga horti]|uniref:YceI family protein n=1 Tax=Chitinophaga horti TaxID=2920382 RepID=A0ABY6J643_9BACT|nr:YceI family protein [Chitinophaga horti]UYQ93722.1 YceI family protein [Chitinophaga horti]
MKQILLLLLVCCRLTVAGQPATWKLDRVHSSVKFGVTHMLISEVEGKFSSYDGTFKSAKPDFTDAVINFNVDVLSIDTDDDNRDKHLRSADFFNAEEYPKMTFKSTKFTRQDENRYLLEGDLTIRGITKKTNFNVTLGGQTTDSKGRTHAGFKANTYINRFDYNLKWDKKTETGGMVVDKMVNVTLNLEFIRQP